MIVKTPTLSELKQRQCSPEELQAALVKLIELHNKIDRLLNNMVADGRIPSRPPIDSNWMVDM